MSIKSEINSDFQEKNSRNNYSKLMIYLIYKKLFYIYFLAL